MTSRKRHRKSAGSAQITLLEAKLRQVPDNAPNKGLWEGALHVLTAMVTTIDEMVVAIRGDSNGEDGLLERVSNLESVVKVLQSDTREILNMVRAIGGYDANGHKEKKKEPSEADRVLFFFRDKVLPGVIIALVVYLLLTFIPGNWVIK